MARTKVNKHEKPENTQSNANSNANTNNSRFTPGQDRGSRLSTRNNTKKRKAEEMDIDTPEEEEENSQVPPNKKIKLNNEINNNNSDAQSLEDIVDHDSEPPTDFTLDDVVVSHIHKKDITLQQIVQRVYVKFNPKLYVNRESQIATSLEREIIIPLHTELQRTRLEVLTLV